VPLSNGTVQKSCQLAVALAQLHQPVTPHTLRHSYATGLLEAGVDLLTISRLLGHSSFTTTMIYLHVRRPHLESTPSPLDWLPVRQCPRWVDPCAEPLPDARATSPPPQGE
jgi:integrase